MNNPKTGVALVKAERATPFVRNLNAPSSSRSSTFRSDSGNWTHIIVAKEDHLGAVSNHVDCLVRRARLAAALPPAGPQVHCAPKADHARIAVNVNLADVAVI